VPWETVKWPLLLPVLVNIVALVLLALYLLSLRFRLGETEERIKREMMQGAA
jgi:hypothetical protein